MPVAISIAWPTITPASRHPLIARRGSDRGRLILGVAAKLEHRRIKERTARGRADAKAKGVKFGRKPKLTPHQQREAIRRRDVEGETLRSIGRSYNVSAQTISRLTA
jgi:DNA invertase Pin-like site-specific DNA recombinase